jgi:hypothetical protein
MGGYAEDLAYAGGGCLEFAAGSKHLYVAGERDDMHSYGAALACTRDIARREQVGDVFTSDFSFAAARATRSRRGWPLWCTTVGDVSAWLVLDALRPAGAGGG